MQKAYKLRDHESYLKIPTSTGSIQALSCQLTGPHEQIAVICHPHPLQKGTMFNKVVTTAARACAKHNLPTLRFNYRGIGESSGKYQKLEDACTDVTTVYQWLQKHHPHQSIWWIGFSFGAYIAAYACQNSPSQGLISISPSMERMPFETLTPPACPWWIIQGTDDQVVNPQAVYDWSATHTNTLIKIDKCSHFYHGQLLTLSSHIEHILQEASSQ